VWGAWDKGSNFDKHSNGGKDVMENNFKEERVVEECPIEKLFYRIHIMVCGMSGQRNKRFSNTKTAE